MKILRKQLAKAAYCIGVIGILAFSLPAQAQVAGVTVSPAAPKAGQTITVSGPLKIGKTIERANVIYYLNSVDENIDRKTFKVDFVANTTKTVSTTFVLPADAKGNYSISVSIYDASFTEDLKYTSNYAVFTAGAATAASCSFNSTTIASGSSVKAYQTASVPSGSTCASQTRTCSNGTLSGSYTYASCTVAAATPAPTPVAGKIKWHPGHYILIDGGNRTDGRWQPLVDGIGNDPYVKGAVFNFRWKSIEVGKGVYDFKLVDSVIARMKAQPLPKRLIIRVSVQAFNPSDPADACDSTIPVDMYKSGLYSVMHSGCTARIWQQETMDRYMNMARALAARYDGEAYVEGVSLLGETATGVASGTDGYSGAALTTQIKRALVEVRKAWPRTNVFLGTNYMPTDAQMLDLIKAAETNRVIIGGPDTLIPHWVLVTKQRALQADEIYRGERGGSKDYRGIIGFKGEVQDPELDGGYFDCPGTPELLYDTMYNINKAQYMVWTTQDYQGPPNTRYTTGIRPFITKVKGVTHTACPTSWNGACDSH